MKENEKKIRETGRKLALPFYIMRLALKISPAYCQVTAGIAAVSAVSPILGAWLTQRILAWLLAGEGRLALLSVVCLVSANFFCMGVSRYLAVKQGVLSERFRDDFKCYVGGRIMSMDFSLLEDARVMDLKERALRPIIDFSVLDIILRETIPGVLSGLLLLAGTAVIAAASYPALVLALVVMAGINLIFVNKTRNIRNETYREVIPVERKIGAYNGITADFSFGKDIRIYDIGTILMDKIRRLNRTDLKAMSAQFGRISKNAGLSAILTQLQLFLVYGLLAVWAMQGKMGIAEYTFYTGIFLNLGVALFNISDKLSNLFYIGNILSAFQEFEEIPMRDDGGEKASSGAPQVEVRDISFSYPGGGAPVLRNLSLTIGKGEHIAIVGRNGAGKTTLVKLLCGLYQPSGGRILFDGEEVDGMGGRSAAVFQDFKLFAYTVYDNVVMGREENAELTPLFDRVGLKEVVEKLPRRERNYLYRLFDTEGVELSGGNGQRLAIARALYRDAPLLLLDEPTAALDPVSEEEVFRCFREISQGKTSVMISHRLSATRFCDRILVLQDGCIAENGSHEELMALDGGIYRNLFETQARYYQEQEGEAL